MRHAYLPVFRAARCVVSRSEGFPLRTCRTARVGSSVLLAMITVTLSPLGARATVINGTSGSNTDSTAYSTTGNHSLSLGFVAEYLIVGGGGGGGSNMGGGGGADRFIAGSVNNVTAQAYGVVVGAGGGGAGGAGQDGGNQKGGNGGGGLSSGITGTLATYAAGGGGGANNDPNNFSANGPGLGGSGIGGNGGQNPVATNGAANTGSGGGGGGNVNTSAGGAGGSGVVIVRYEGDPAATGGTRSAGTGTAAGYTLHEFTTVGSAESLDFTGLDLNTRFGATLTSGITGTGNLTYAGPGTLTLDAVPEPSALALLGCGVLSAAGFARRRWVRQT